MLEFDFLQELTNEQIASMTQVFKVLSKPLHWELIRAAIQAYPYGLTSGCFKDKCSRNKVHTGLKKLAEIGFLVRENISTSAKLKHYLYKLNVKLIPITEYDRYGRGVRKFKKFFENLSDFYGWD